jgi:biopolymer transport protein ExbB
MRLFPLAAIGLVLTLFFQSSGLVAQEASPPVPEAKSESAAPPVAPSESPLVEKQSASPHPERMTLGMMIESGGPVLWVIIVLSVVMVVFAIYLTVTLTVSREAPPQLIKRAHAQIASGDFRGAYQMCEDRQEILANVLRAGLKLTGHDRFVVQEAMESEGARAATMLWQRIAYLNNIGVIAPLLGLLGTVTGMIGAFSAIALDDSKVKSLNMAYSVSQAMMTTAAGLLVAIVAMTAHFYLRGRVIKIVAEIESQASEFVEAISRGAKT